MENMGILIIYMTVCLPTDRRNVPSWRKVTLVRRHSITLSEARSYFTKFKEVNNSLSPNEVAAQWQADSVLLD